MEPSTNSVQNGMMSQFATQSALSLVISAAVLGVGYYMLPPRGGLDQGLAPLSQVAYNNAAGGGIVFGKEDEVRFISGTITEIKGNSFTLKVLSRDGEDPSLAERSVWVSSKTAIYKVTAKDRNVLTDEMVEYNKKLKTSKQLVIAPDPFDRKQADASQVNIGDMVSVTSSVDLKTQNSFLADEIEIQPAAPTFVRK